MATKRTSQEGLTGLIERLEKATGTNRELDLSIWEVSDKQAHDGCLTERLQFAAPHKKYVDDKRMIYAPKFTASIDAALTLVPEGSYGFAYPWFYSEYSRYEKPCVFWRAAIHKPIWEKATPSLAGDDWFERYECNEDMASPALALCIAALKSRASQANIAAGKP